MWHRELRTGPSAVNQLRAQESDVFYVVVQNLPYSNHVAPSPGASDLKSAMRPAFTGGPWRVWAENKRPTRVGMGQEEHS